MKNSEIAIKVLSVVLCLLSGAAILGAQPSQDEATKVMESIKWQKGPCSVTLGAVADLKVPEGFIFADGPDTRKIMEVFGNIPSDEEVGLLAPASLDWFILYEFSEVGYVKDDEKDSLDADALLKRIQQSNEEGNKIRKKKGFPSLLNVAWLTKPYYDESTHNLEWATQAEDEEGEKSVNHNTRLLGRKGIMEVTLVGDPEEYVAALPDFRNSLKDFSFKTGNTYAEFRQGDKLATYGLTALVAGGAAAVAVKTGLFKYLGKFLVFILAGLAAFFKKIWARIKGFISPEEKIQP